MGWGGEGVVGYLWSHVLSGGKGLGYPGCMVSG